jgi:hypothetical protein
MVVFTAFLGVVMCSLVDRYQRFRAICCLHLQDSEVGGNRLLQNVGMYLLNFWCNILQGVRKVWNQSQFYLLFTLYALHVHPDTTHFLGHFTMFVWILLNILGSTVAQQPVILCLR